MMKKRIIARIDVKNEFVIKGIQLEGLRKLGDPNVFAQNYYNNGIDEIIFMDAVAAYYDRNSLSDIIEKAVRNIFVPITVGGGIRKLEDIELALKSGADKVAINTAAIKNPDFINKSADKFGSQCIVAQIDVKRVNGIYKPYYDNGREPSNLELNEWINELEYRGAGEIMLTSIDREGTKLGFDENILNSLNEAVNIPLIVSGGFGKKEHCIEVLKDSKVDAIALASLLHYELGTISELKDKL